MNAALITGSARRIGERIALDLAREGYAVCVHYNESEGEAASVVETIRGQGGKADLVAADLSDAGEASELIGRAARLFGPPSCLINNASRFEPDEVGSITVESWERHLGTNLRAPVLLSQSFADHLPPRQEGNIVNIIDQRVWKLNPKFFSYTASKAALWTVTRTLAQALAPRIRVNAVGPGPALPNARMDQEDFAKQSRLTLLQRGTTPSEISDAVRFILAARAMTGQMIVLDGGQHLVWQTPDVVGVRE